MSNDAVSTRIRRWESEGLIDTVTATRLRAFEAVPGLAGERDLDAGSVDPRPTLSSFFGPAVGFGELLGYVGASFVLLGWHGLVESTLLGDPARESVFRALEMALPAVLLVAAGLALDGRREDSSSRAAGVALALASGYVAFAARFVVQAAIGPDDHVPLDLVTAAAGTASALALSRVHRALATHIAVMVWSVAVIGTSAAWAQSMALDDTFTRDPVTSWASVIGTLAWWLIGAAVLAVPAEFSVASIADGPEDAAAAGRLAAITRVSAGLAAIFGTGMAVLQSVDGERIVPPTIGDLVLLLVAGGLVAVAFRTRHSAYLYPAAIGVVVALTDVNARLIADRTGVAVALIVEGVVLVAAGAAAMHLSRRVGPAWRLGPAEEG